MVQENDPLPQREALYRLGNKLASSIQGLGGFSVRYMGNSCVQEVKRTDENGERLEVIVQGSDGRTQAVLVDNIIAHVGYKPDTEITRELQVWF